MGQITWHRTAFPFNEREIPASENFTKSSLIAICICSLLMLANQYRLTARMIANVRKDHSILLF